MDENIKMDFKSEYLLLLYVIRVFEQISLLQNQGKLFEISSRCTLAKTAGVDFTNILRKLFMHVDLKSAKKY